MITFEKLIENKKNHKLEIVVDLNVSNWAEIMSVISPSEKIITSVTSGFLEMLFEVEYEFTPDRQNPSLCHLINQHNLGCL